MKNMRRNAPYAVIVLLCASNIATGGWLWYTFSVPSLEEAQWTYPRIDPARSFIPQSDYIVNIQPLREEVHTIAAEHGDSVSVYIEFLNTGANISVNPTSYIFPASLIKLHLSMAAMKKIERGEWDLRNELILTAGDKDDKSGSPDKPLWEKPVGTRFTIEALLQELLVHSDNTAHNILYRNMDYADVRDVMEDLGIESLFVEGGKMSAKEYSRLFRALYTSSYLRREHSEMILEWLDQSTFNEFLAYSVPEEVPFSHKYGENNDLRVYSDSGIVYLPNRPYIITVMVAGNPEVPLEDDEQRAAELMRSISAAAYRYFSSY